ncbi:hypothetical protein BP6252_06178 [Coleophoma cylindrospora]|uniref:Uncharacterized protein n=1 Tax=Coleophoma cylindrospora TaxID=1849047 RepID=A0A3D8RM69_9HELO|nr:hypothetical protein BP6252_06178 [Coleophoma cylindrospora]
MIEQNDSNSRHGSTDELCFDLATDRDVQRLGSPADPDQTNLPVKPRSEYLLKLASKPLSSRNFNTEMQKSMDRILKWRNFITVFGVLVLGAGLALLALHCVVRLQYRRNYAVCHRRYSHATHKRQTAVIASSSQLAGATTSPQAAKVGNDLERGGHNSSSSKVPASSYDGLNDQSWVCRAFKTSGRIIHTSVIIKPSKVYIPPWLARPKHEQLTRVPEYVGVLEPYLANRLDINRPRRPLIFTTILEAPEPADDPNEILLQRGSVQQ